jgi:hypothetical protein
MSKTLSDVLQRIRSEYLEMPGLSLTANQIQRLCAIESEVCGIAIDALVSAGFLSMRPGGAYGRFRNPDVARVRAAKVNLDGGFVTATDRLRSRAS